MSKIALGAKNFEMAGALFITLNKLEEDLKSLRDNVDTPTQKAINSALATVSPVRDALWKVDASLAQGKGV